MRVAFTVDFNSYDLIAYRKPNGFYICHNESETEALARELLERHDLTPITITVYNAHVYAGVQFYGAKVELLPTPTLVQGCRTLLAALNPTEAGAEES